ncbi:MAG: Ldh family oxidoreductase [Pseudomonadales bacterium]
MSARYSAPALERFASDLLVAAGLPPARAAALARIFVTADLLGYSTHGLQRLPSNLRWLEQGRMRREGEPEVLRDRLAVFSWDAHFLPGPWVLTRAVDEALGRVARTGVVTATLRRCSHVACLAAYLVPVLERRLVGLLVVSTPDERFISPFGGRDAVFSNNPLAFCAPTGGLPILFDVSMAITAGGRIARAAREGRQLPEACLKTADGRVSADPAVLSGEPPGTVMPIGGPGHGHKGYALTLMTEVLSQALSGHGRSAAAGEGEANSVFLQVLDPEAFTDWSDYQREVDVLVSQCLDSRADRPEQPVRIPGHAAWRRRQQQLAQGVSLYPGILAQLETWAGRLHVTLPVPLA